MRVQQATVAAILFPGQGASLSGAKARAEQGCPRLYQRALDDLGVDPFDHAHVSTRYAQPATFLASLAGWRAATAAGVEPFALAGHSLGELSALAAAEVFTVEDALELVLLRGRLTAEVSSASIGGLLAVIDGDVAQAERLALAHGLRVANYNAPGQTVLAGSEKRLEDAARDAEALGLRALRLRVNGAFHTPALRPARVRFQQALRRVPLEPPKVPVLSSMTARPFTDPVNELGAALIQPVRWTETMATLKQLGAPAYLDVGPDRVVERLARRNLGDMPFIDREALDACG
jgi:[acyl-carrier-protein] S-malonyltransferase